MAPYALCTGVECGFVFDYAESDSEESKPSRVPPALCPQCGADLLTHCLGCFSSIGRIPPSPGSLCEDCGEKLFAADAERKPQRSEGLGHSPGFTVARLSADPARKLASS